ncbi:MAG TPA: hypothetical protein VEC56_06860, partial [Candidatus Krumholzibacteria bacterium]|nr:hypothetical protein [Candidatus Krumholzibacteria bacterium]
SDGFTTGLSPAAGGLYVASFDAVSDKVVHRYDALHRWVSSFSDSWSAVESMPFDVERWCNGGAIDVGPDGSVYYTQWTPYEIRKFTPDGKLRLTIRRENDFKPPRVERQADSVAFYNYTGSSAILVLSDGRILNVVSVVADDHKIVGTLLELFDADGRFLKSIKVDRLVGIKCRDARDRIYAWEARVVPQVVRYRLGFR